MGKRRYNAEAAERRGETTRRDVCMGTLSALDTLTRAEILRRNCTRKRYWLPDALAVVLDVETIPPPEASGAPEGMVLSPVGEVLAQLDSYITDRVRPVANLAVRAIAEDMRQIAGQTGAGVDVQ